MLLQKMIYIGIDRKDTCNNEYNGCTNGTCKTIFNFN